MSSKKDGSEEDDLDAEIEEENMNQFKIDDAEWDRRLEESSKASAKLGAHMLQGWTMLAEHCPKCASPFMSLRAGPPKCVVCPPATTKKATIQPTENEIPSSSTTTQKMDTPAQNGINRSNYAASDGKTPRARYTRDEEAEKQQEIEPPQPITSQPSSSVPRNPYESPLRSHRRRPTLGESSRSPSRRAVPAPPPPNRRGADRHNQGHRNHPHHPRRSNPYRPYQPEWLSRLDSRYTHDDPGEGDPSLRRRLCEDRQRSQLQGDIPSHWPLPSLFDSHPHGDPWLERIDSVVGESVSLVLQRMDRINRKLSGRGDSGKNNHPKPSTENDLPTLADKKRASKVFHGHHHHHHHHRKKFNDKPGTGTKEFKSGYDSDDERETSAHTQIRTLKDVSESFLNVNAGQGVSATAASSLVVMTGGDDKVANSIDLNDDDDDEDDDGDGNDPRNLTGHADFDSFLDAVESDAAIIQLLDNCVSFLEKVQRLRAPPHRHHSHHHRHGPPPFPPFHPPPSGHFGGRRRDHPPHPGWPGFYPY